MIVSRSSRPYTLASPPPRTLSIDERLDMIAREFAALPGLRLTAAQACRLWSLERDECDLLFTRLVERRFLRRTADGCYMRAELSPVLSTFSSGRAATRGVA
jgi:hypothetical protein